MNKKRYAIPLMAAAALVPLITFVTARKADFSAFPWFPNQNYWVDIFLYGKSRLLMGLGVIMGGILAYEGVRSRLRKPGREFLFLGLFAVLLLLSTAMSEYPYYSLEGIMEQYEPLGVQLSYLLLCLYAYEYVVTGGKGEPVENAFLVGCGIQCFIGYAQMLQYVQKPETWKGLYLTLYNPIKLSGAFTDDAYVRVSYNGQTRIYRADELNLTYAKNGTATGYVDVVLDVSDPDKTPGNAEIRVSTDNNNNVKTWTLNLSRLQREAEQRACGTVTEPSDVYGIRTSSPVIVEENDGTDVTVTYPSVS